jgi:hypothetical protein
MSFGVLFSIFLHSRSRLFKRAQVAERVRAESEPGVNVFANELLAEAALKSSRTIAAGSSAHDNNVTSSDSKPHTAVSEPRATAVALAATLLEENAVNDVVRAGFWRWRAGQLLSP